LNNPFAECMTMNNIFKIVLGVLAVVGIAVLLMPKGNPLDKKTGAQPSEPTEQLIPQVDEPSSVVPPEQANTPPPPFVVNATEAPAFGQPMLDPTPPGSKPKQQNVQPAGPQTTPNTGEPAQEKYTIVEPQGQ
jgi:hypothetical protein